eukprot:Tamp_10891.p1 GENE.Tamp_10891~~Tamp_10891.p1  ORF type:complete len:430 (+),score=49.46 Tamp_10891:46-1290(+)
MADARAGGIDEQEMLEMAKQISPQMEAKARAALRDMDAAFDEYLGQIERRRQKLRSDVAAAVKEAHEAQTENGMDSAAHAQNRQGVQDTLAFQKVGAKLAKQSLDHFGVVLASCIIPMDLSTVGTIKGYKNAIGGEGVKDAQFNYPWYVCLDRAGHLIVSDYGNHRVQIVQGDGTWVRTIGSKGNGAGEFRNPRGVALNSKNELLVVDSINCRIQVFCAATGQNIATVGEQGSGPCQFRSPAGICVDSQGRVLVAEWDNHRVQILNPDYTHSCFIGCNGLGEGEFSNPRGIAVDGADNILVTDTGNHRVQVFTSEGEFIFSIGGRKGSKPGELADPWGVAVDGQGNILVTEWGNHRVQVLRGDGTFIRSIGNEGNGVLEFKGPLGVAVDQQGKIVVADLCNHRIHVIPSPNSSS